MLCILLRAKCYCKKVNSFTALYSWHGNQNKTKDWILSSNYYIYIFAFGWDVKKIVVLYIFRENASWDVIWVFLPVILVDSLLLLLQDFLDLRTFNAIGDPTLARSLVFVVFVEKVGTTTGWPHLSSDTYVQQ